MRLLLLLIFGLNHIVAIAYDYKLFVPAKKNSSIADFAEGLFNFGEGLGQLVKTTAVIVGVVIILFSILQYGKHRRNPDETTISSVLMTFFVGLGLIGLAFIPMKF